MPKNPFIAPFSLKIKSSPQKLLLITAPHLFLLILVLEINIFLPSLKLFLILLIVTSAYYYSRLHYFYSSNKSVTELRQDSNKNWKISTVKKHNNGELFSVDILPSSFVSKWLIILNLVDNKSSNHYVLLLTPDSISVHDFRHLTIRLKLTNSKKE